MDVLRGNIVEIYLIDTGTVFNVVSHAGRSGDIVHLPVRMRFQFCVRRRSPCQSVSVRLSSAFGIYLLQPLLDLEQPGTAGDAVCFQGRTDGKADGLFRATPVGNDEISRERVKPTFHTLDRSVKRLEVNGYICPIKAFISNSGNIDTELLNRYLNSLTTHEGETEPRFNMFAWRDTDGKFITAYFPREAHRPSCYFAEGKEQIFVSPGALDMAGLIVTPREEDFKKITEKDIKKIYKEVSSWKNHI